jgi:hypothetical protein
MTKTTITWLLFFLFINITNTFAKEHIHIPKQFNIYEQKGNQIPNFTISSENSTLALVYQKWENKYISYSLYCPLGHQIAYASTPNYLHHNMIEIKDEKHAILGTLEKISGTFKTNYYLYANLSRTPLLIIRMSALQNEFDILEPENKNIMIKLNRPIKKSTLVWSVSVTNPILLTQKKIDSRLLLTSLVLLIGIQNQEFNS